MLLSMVLSQVGHAQVVVTADSDKPRYVLGEPIWVDVRLENGSEQTLSVAGMVCKRNNRIANVKATLSDGSPAPDLVWTAKKQIGSGPPISWFEVLPGESFEGRLDLQSCLSVRTGTVSAEVGPVIRAPDPVSSGVGATSFRVRPPNDGQVAKNLEVVRGASPMRLAHARYVPNLAQIVGKLPLNRTQTMDAFRALEGCPCVEATTALLDLLEGDLDSQRRQRIDDTIRRRLPQSGGVLGPHWDPVQRGRAVGLYEGRLLDGTPDAGDVAWSVVAALGGEGSAGALVEGLDRLLDEPNVMDIEHILWLIRSTGYAPDPTDESEVASLLRLPPLRPVTPSDPPDDWNDGVLRLLASERPAVVRAAVWRAPRVTTEANAAVREAVGAWLKSHPRELWPPASTLGDVDFDAAFLLDAIKTVPAPVDHRGRSPVEDALGAKVPLEQVLQALGERLESEPNPSVYNQWAMPLLHPECDSWSPVEVDAEQLARVVPLWSEVVRDAPVQRGWSLQVSEATYIQLGGSGTRCVPLKRRVPTPER